MKSFILGISLFFIALAASATPAYVQGSYTCPQTAQTSVTIAYSAAQVAGDLNIVVVGWNDTTAWVSSVTDTRGNVYQLAVGPTQVSGALSQSIYYANNIAAASGGTNAVKVAFSAAAAYPDIRILEYSGLDPNSPLDAAIGATGSSATSASGNLTTRSATDLLIGANIVAQGTTGPGTGFTQRFITNPNGDIAEDWVVTAIGSYGATAPVNGGAWVMQAVAFVASGQAPPPPTYQEITRWPLIFDDEFNDSSTIDTAATGNGGLNWYPEMFFGFGTNPSYDYSVSGGVLTINDANDNWNDTLHTAHPANNASGWAGTCFAGGSGIYFEASIAVSNLAHIGASSGWPSFWLDSINRETGIGNGMLGWPGVTEACEPDIMEYNPTWFSGSTQEYLFTLHDWMSAVPDGGFGQGETEGVPINPGEYHRYGMLYIPASASNGWNGYAQAYFDGVAGDKIPWVGNQTYSGPMPPTWASMTATEYLFSEMDRDLFMLILGSSTLGTTTMSVDYVRVYALDPSRSLIQQ
jgi:hypothetical protein